MSEATSYTAWDDNLYEWPPPEGWYQASDGRWWPQGYGPEASSDEPGPTALNGDSPGAAPDDAAPDDADPGATRLADPDPTFDPDPGATRLADLDPTFDPDRTSVFPAGGSGIAFSTPSDRYEDQSRRRMFEEPPPIDDVFGGIDPFALSDDPSDDGVERLSGDPPGDRAGQGAADPGTMDPVAEPKAVAPEPTVLVPPASDAPAAPGFAEATVAIGPSADDAPFVPDPVPFDDAPFDDAPFGDAPFGDAPLDDAPFDDGPFDDGPFDDAPLDDGPFDGVPAGWDSFGATRLAPPPGGLDAKTVEDATAPIDLGRDFESGPEVPASAEKSASPGESASVDRPASSESTVALTTVASGDWGRGDVHVAEATAIASGIPGVPLDNSWGDPGGAPARRRLWPLVAIGLAVALVAVGLAAYLALRPGGDDADAAEAEVVGPGSFDEPYAFGTGVVVFYADEASGGERRWVIQVLDQVVDATDILVNEASAAPPEPGEVLATVRVRVTYQSGPEPGSLADLRFNAVGDSRTTYTQIDDGCSAVTDPVDLAASLAVLESAEGNLCWSVSAEDLSSLNLAIEAGDTAGTVHLRLR